MKESVTRLFCPERFATAAIVYVVTLKGSRLSLSPDTGHELSWSRAEDEGARVLGTGLGSIGLTLATPNASWMQDKAEVRSKDSRGSLSELAWDELSCPTRDRDYVHGPVTERFRSAGGWNLGQPCQPRGGIGGTPHCGCLEWNPWPRCTETNGIAAGSLVRKVGC